MRSAVAWHLLAALAVSSSASGVRVSRGVAKVVTMLQEMLDKAEQDQKKDDELYDKFKCYCDDNENEKTESISDLKTQIAVLGSKVEELKASTGEHSTACATLKEEMAENEAARAEASTLREKAHEEFVKEEEELKSAIETMGEALKVLSEVGGDQTMSASAEHKQFMAGQDSLIKLRARVHSALIAASAFLAAKDKRPVNAFLQSPFGTYSAASGEVVGILKNMKQTFETNLESAQEAEKAAQEAHEKFMKTKKEAYDEMKAQYDKKQGILGNNDDDLATKKEQLDEAIQKKASDEEFLAKLVPMCEKKAKTYHARREMRTNEQAALSQAIAILTNDVAAEKFGKVKATGGGAASLLQLGAVSSHAAAAEATTRLRAVALLQAAARKHTSLRLLRVASLLEGGNPFERVLSEIDKIIALIGEEAEVDKKNLDWCNAEREVTNKELDDAKAQISTLETEIEDLGIAIDDPETGLLVQIKETETSLEDGHKSQLEETATRGEENTLYQKDTANMAEAIGILHEAVAVLKEFYASKGEESLAQEDPAPPETWDDEETGASEKGGEVIKLLESVIEDTEKEEAEAHKAEEEAQHAYEDSMAELKEQEAKLSETLVDLKATLAEKQQALAAKKADLAATTETKEAAEKYLEKLKAGCDFITDNFETRETNRETEIEALKGAKKVLTGSPAYKAATTKAKEDAWGDCKATCLANEGHADCKACVAGVSVPGYCAGHPGAEGC